MDFPIVGRRLSGLGQDLPLGGHGALDRQGAILQVYVCEFASEAAKQTAWDTFKADPDWLSLIAQTDPKGPIVSKSTSEMLTPISFASMR